MATVGVSRIFSRGLLFYQIYFLKERGTAMLMISRTLLFALAIFTLPGCATSDHHEGKIQRKHYGEWEKGVGYTQVVRVDNTLYLAGVGSEGATLVDQMDGIYATIRNILADYNATTSDIVKEVIYTTNMDQLTEAVSARKAHFNDDEYPSATWVQIERLFSPHMLIEVEVVAQVPE